MAGKRLEKVLGQAVHNNTRPTEEGVFIEAGEIATPLRKKMRIEFLIKEN